MDWEEFLGTPIFSADAVPAVDIRGTLISFRFESGYCAEDMRCPVNIAIATAVKDRLESIFARHAMEKDFLRDLVTDDAEIRAYVHKGWLRFDFSGIALPVCVAYALVRGLTESFGRDPVRVRISPYGAWCEPAFSTASIRPY